jgi:hypothetical protein
MKLLSEDDLNLEEMSDEELAAAWDLWFDLAQTTNDADPPYTHGVFVGLTLEDVAPVTGPPPAAPAGTNDSEQAGGGAPLPP